jgi:hypothetical protein
MRGRTQRIPSVEMTAGSLEWAPFRANVMTPVISVDDIGPAARAP